MTLAGRCDLSLRWGNVPELSGCQTPLVHLSLRPQIHITLTLQAVITATTASAQSWRTILHETLSSEITSLLYKQPSSDTMSARCKSAVTFPFCILCGFLLTSFPFDTVGGGRCNSSCQRGNSTQSCPRLTLPCVCVRAQHSSLKLIMEIKWNRMETPSAEGLSFGFFFFPVEKQPIDLLLQILYNKNSAHIKLVNWLHAEKKKLYESAACFTFLRQIKFSSKESKTKFTVF